MKKRLLSLALAAVLLLALFPALPVQAADLKAFTDVDSGEWYAPYVYALVQKGIINGMTDTTFAPTEPLTRAQLMKMLACFAADEKTLSAAGKQQFPDVKSTDWFAPYVNWAAEKKIADGYDDGSFGPDRSITRNETATLASRFAKISDSVDLKKVKDKEAFKDDGALPGWAKEHVYFCQESGIVDGYDDGTFQGGKQIIRSEAAKLLCVLFGIQPLAKDALPVNPVAAVRSVPSSVAGYAVTGVEFDPQAFRAGIVLAQDRFYATENAASMAQRTGAVVACNGAFFNNASDLTTWSCMVRDGKALRIDNAHGGQKCYFVVDENGRASMQFLTVNQKVELVRGGEVLYSYDNVGCNFALEPGDGTRMIFTSEFGQQVPIQMKCAVYCDANGVVTSAMDSGSAQTISIPSNGFVLCCAARRDEGDNYKWDKLFADAKPGDVVRRTLSYGNSSVQNIRMVLCNGPTVVKNGQVYGDMSTYAAEGFTEGLVVSGASERMAIGVKPDGTVIMASAVCDLRGLGTIMQALGCQTAMNLDGGASRALYINGSPRIAAGRELSHLIIFTQR